MILVLEEDIAVKNLIKSYLNNKDFLEFVFAPFKKSALKTVDEHSVSLVIICMESTNNFDEYQVEEIKYILSNLSVPVIVVSDLPITQLNIPDFPSVALIPKRHFKNLFSLIAINQNKSDDSLICDRASIYVLKNNRYHKVYLKDIYLVHADEGCIKIKTRYNIFTLSSTIRKFKEQVDQSNFINVHRSYLINTIHIKSFDSHNLYMGDAVIPISKNGMITLLKSVRKIKSK